MRKGVRHHLLLLFALLSDATGEISLHAVYKRYWWPEYKLPSLYASVSRMVRVGEMERTVTKKGEARLRLKAKGGRLLDQVLPFNRLQQKRWDGKWRFVIFDIPEQQRLLRGLVRDKLKHLGFGMWQKSVYASPHDVVREVNEFLEEQRIFPMVACFESYRTGVGSDREFADLVFKTEKLNRRYLSMVDDVDELSYEAKKKAITTREFERRFVGLWNHYLDLVNSDPFLPFELLPMPWYADQAKKALRQINSHLP